MTTNHYECLKCKKACDVFTTNPLPARSKCCGAPVKVVSGKEP